MRLGPAQAAPAQGVEPYRTGHVGYYLIDRGRAELERVSEVRLPLCCGARRAASRTPLIWYLGTITLLAVLLTAGVLAAVRMDRMATWEWLTLGALGLLAASQLALALVQRLGQSQQLQASDQYNPYKKNNGTAATLL
jgi:hypothetical protein